jgi:hypothetical protein
MLEFLTPERFNTLIWAVIVIGGAAAVLRLVKDLTGPPRWKDDADSSGPAGPHDRSPEQDMK